MPIHIRTSASGAAALLVLSGLLAACVGSGPVSPSITAATPSPASGTSDALDPRTFHVALTHETDDVVTVDVTDESGRLVIAESGVPGDGASVEAYTVQVANEGPTTLRLTWVGGPCDSANSLAIDASAGGFLLVQPECPGDAVATDRVLILGFDEPIEAADVHAVIQDGLDTPS